MLLFYINFGDRNPPYPALGSNIPSARRRGQRFHFLHCKGVFSESSLRKQAWRNPKEGRVGCLHQNIFTRKVTDIAFTSDFCNNYSHPASPTSLCLTSPRPRPTRPRVPYLMSSSPSSRVPKSPSPHTRVPMSPSHFYTQPFCLMEVPFIPRLLSYWKSQLPQGLMGCICRLRRFLFSFVCFYFPCGGKKTQTRSTKCTFKVTFFIFLNKLNVWKRCSVLE